MNTQTSSANGNDNSGEISDQGGFGSIDSGTSTDGTSTSGAGDPSSETGQDESASGGTSEFSMPEGLQDESGAFLADKVTEHLKAQHEANQARAEKFGEVPEGDYEIPKEFKVEGFDEPLALDPENEFLKGFLADAKEMGIGQKGVNELLDKYVKSVVTDTLSVAGDSAEKVLKDQNAKMLSEYESLGDQRDARLKSIRETVSEMVSQEASDALVNDIRTKAGFEAIEALIAKAQGGQEGAAPLNGEGSAEDNASILFS